MNRLHIRILFLLLALVALLVVSYDYTCGHTLDEVLTLEYCPICDSYHAAIAGFLLLRILIFVCFLPILCCFPRDGVPHLRHLCDPSVISYRAPPAAS